MEGNDQGLKSNYSTNCKYCAQAFKNEEFLFATEAQNPDDFHDWKVTIVFYIANQLISAYASHNGIVCKNHGDIFDAIYGVDGEKSTLKMDHGAKIAYSRLFKFSRVTRYEGHLDSKAARKTDKLRLRDAKDYLGIVKKDIVPRLEKAHVLELVEL